MLNIFKSKKTDVTTDGTTITSQSVTKTISGKSNEGNQNSEYQPELISKLLQNDNLLKEIWNKTVKNATNGTYESFVESIHLLKKTFSRNIDVQSDYLFSYLKNKELTVDFANSKQKELFALYEELKGLIAKSVPDQIDEETFDPDALLETLDNFGKKFIRKIDALEKQVYPLYKK